MVSFAAFFLTLTVVLSCYSEEKVLHVTRAVVAPEVLLHGATTVARVRISTREPMIYDWEQKSSPCGYHYYSDVVDSLKGESKYLDFVSSEVVEPGSDCLVAVVDLAGELPAEIDDPELTERDAVYLRCRVKVPRYALDMIRLEEQGGDWLVPTAGARILPDSLVQEQTGGRIPWLNVRERIEDLLAGVNSQ
jgi:hypothetical protein